MNALNFLSLPLFFLFLGNNKPEGINLNNIVAKVDSIKITAEEFYLSYEYGPAFPKREKDSKERYLNYMINEKLLALDGYSRKLDTTQEAVETLNEFKNDLAAEELFKKDILSRIKIEQPEIDSAVSKKNIMLEIKWLFAESDEKVKIYLTLLKSGSSFDSLFNQQLSSSVFRDDRYLKTDMYSLQRKNTAIAVLVDSLRAGEFSLPIHTGDGWYIVKLENVVQNLINSESDYERAKQEAVNSLKKEKMDKLSDKYVHEIMLNHKPVIKRDAFNLLRSYLGNMILSKEKYGRWALSEKLNSALKNLNTSGKENYSKAMLVELNDGQFSIAEFLSWYRNRSEYINLDKKELKNFSVSLENLIWRMVRDRLLAGEAFKRGFNNSESVVKQTGWWRDKIISSMVKNEIGKSAVLESTEIKKINEKDSIRTAEVIEQEYDVKLLRKILSLKKRYKTLTDEKLLKQIDVSDENDPRAVEFYTVKQGTLIPRTPYPTIDPEWAKWE